MKKISILILTVVMIFGLAACSEKADTEKKAESTEQDAVMENDEEQRKIDADHVQIQYFANAITVIYSKQKDVVARTENRENGIEEETEILDKYRQMADASKELLDELQKASWVSGQYDKEIATFTAAAEALEQCQRTFYEAALEGDQAKLEEAETYMEATDVKMGEFFEVMGIE